MTFAVLLLLALSQDVADLGSDDCDVREAAEERLVVYAESVRPLLEHRYQDAERNAGVRRVLARSRRK